MDTFDIGEAVRRLKDGKRVANSRLHQAGQYLYFVKGSSFLVNRPPLNEHFDGQTVAYAPHIDAFTSGFGDCVHCAGVYEFCQADILATDWREV